MIVLPLISPLHARARPIVTRLK